MMKRVLAAVLLGFGLTAGAVMANVEDEIRARIAPVGEVCVQGEDCGQAAAPSASASSGPRSGSDVYDAACHPVLKKDWTHWSITRSTASMPCRPRAVVPGALMRKSRAPSSTWLRPASSNCIPAHGRSKSPRYYGGFLLVSGMFTR